MNIKNAGKTRLCFAIVVLFLATLSVRAQDVVVVANPNVQITTITSGELRDIFTGARTSFRDRTHAIPVTLKGGPAHEVFLHNHLGETPDSFRTFWRKALFSGEGAPPKEFGSEAALLQFVAATPGAIGYVSRVNDAFTVKILVVQRISH